MAGTRKNGFKKVMTVISVITPTFNRADFLPAAISSVLAQTYEDFELIVVDDGSVDDTCAVIKPFLDDKRVRYFYQENQGQSVARNYTLAQSSGEFIAFLDSDDLWCPDKLEKQLRAYGANPGVDIVHGDEVLINEQGEVISRKNMGRCSGCITRQLLADNSVSITTALVKRRCFDEMGGFDTSVGVADDYELWLRFSARYRFHYEPGIVVSYRVMEAQISSDKRRRFAANEMIITNFLEQYGDGVSRQDVRWGLSRFYCRKARYYAGINEKQIAVHAVLKAFGLAPTDPTIWRAIYRTFFPKRSVQKGLRIQ